MGLLQSKAPPGDTLEMHSGATIEDALRSLDIAVDSVQVFTVNGALERDRNRVLDDDDELTILPPVGGG